MRVLTLPGVFKPRSDSWMLAAHVARAPLPPGARVLELGTGSGIAAVAAARRGADVTAVDVSRRAVLTAKANARLNGTRVRAMRGDLLAPVAGRSFHLIAANPPYLPGGSDELPGSGPERAWEGGPDGRRVLDRILTEAPARLEPGGVLLLVHSSVCGEEETLAALRDAGLEPEVRERRRGPLGPLLAARADALATRGLLGDGRPEEDVLVIAGRRPEDQRAESVTGTPKRRSASRTSSSR